ncbi:MAG: hypothetical protein NVS1B4_24790 [Gemmatimonadaceae bacterium]
MAAPASASGTSCRGRPSRRSAAFRATGSYEGRADSLFLHQHVGSYNTTYGNRARRLAVEGQALVKREARENGTYTENYTRRP